jgi:hypothetical protein
LIATGGSVVEVVTAHIVTRPRPIENR